MLDAVTGSADEGLVDDSGTRSDPLVAPLTNFAVARVKRDLRGGETSIGLSATAVDRALDGTPLAATLHDQAYTSGLQLQHRWDDNAWQANFSTVGSWVHGTTDAMIVTQELNRHLFQRPDATDVHFDPTLTSLGGLGATWKVGRLGNTEHWRFGTGGDLRTPGLELNDVGFQTSSDQILPFVWMQYHDETPGDDVLNWQVSGDVYTISNFEPTLLNEGFESNISTQLASYWSLNAGLNGQHGGWDPVALRGGPALRVDPNLTAMLGLSTDNRRRVRFDVSTNLTRDWTADMMSGELDVTATIQARSNIDLMIGPTWYRRDDPMQYVAEADDAGGNHHYILGHIDQTTAAMTMRLNWTFSPHLSLQVYAQPFIATGRYSELKDVDHPHAAQFQDRFHVLAGNQYRVADDVVYASYSGAYNFASPDFDVEQLHSTIVLRWEYRPGSTVFGIWSHGRTNTLDGGRCQLGRDLADLAHTPGENLVMIKVNYWLGF